MGQNDKFKTYDTMMDNRDARLEKLKNTMNQTRDDTDETLTELRHLIMERTSLHANYIDEIEHKSQQDYALFESLTTGL